MEVVLFIFLIPFLVFLGMGILAMGLSALGATVRFGPAVFGVIFFIIAPHFALLSLLIWGIFKASGRLDEEIHQERPLFRAKP